MKQEIKHALTRQRIVDAAMEEFSRNGYEQASTNTICSQYSISKGVIYHYFKDKDELYLICVQNCFDALTEYLEEVSGHMRGSPEKKLQTYFDARLHYFADHQNDLGIFASAVFFPPSHLTREITELRLEFDELNVSVLTSLLKNHPLRKGLKTKDTVHDFEMYMEYFNLHFKEEIDRKQSLETLLAEHEERCHRQLNILLYGVLEKRK